MLPDHEIRKLVRGLKEEIGLGEDDLVADIDSLIKLAGYNLEESHFRDSFSAASISRAPGKFLILYNKNHHWSEKFRRFTLAHELGHLTIPSHRALLVANVIQSSSPEYTSLEATEREADKFAINFLAPRSAFKKEMITLGYSREDIMSLSDTFQISAYATAHRFVELAVDFPCSLIACHKNGNIEYEIRSIGMKNLVRGHRSLNSLPVNSSTLASEFIRGVNDTVTIQLSLSEWYQDLEVEIRAKESVIDLGYNQLYLALIEPFSMALPNEDDQGPQDRLPSERWKDSYKY